MTLGDALDAQRHDGARGQTQRRTDRREMRRAAGAVKLDERLDGAADLPAQKGVGAPPARFAQLRRARHA